MEVTREIVFPAPPDEVWEALTDPDQLEEWFANDVELDAQEGGEGVFRWDNGEERHATVVEAAPGERLVLDWDDEGTVELTLEEVEEGTRLLVRETELAAELPVTRQAVAKHLAALNEAGLVESRREGRETRYELTPAPLGAAMDWMAGVGAEWDARLAALRKHLKARRRG